MIFSLRHIISPVRHYADAGDFFAYDAVFFHFRHAISLMLSLFDIFRLRRHVLRHYLDMLTLFTLFTGLFSFFVTLIAADAVIEFR